MEEFMHYLMKASGETERLANCIASHISKQKKINRRTAILGIITGIYIVGTDLYLKEHDKKFVALQKELAEQKTLIRKLEMEIWSKGE